MQSVTKTNNLLTIKVVPVIMWGIVMVFWILAGMVTVDFITDYLAADNTATASQIAILVIGGVGSFAGGIAIIFKAPITKIQINSFLPDIEVTTFAATGKSAIHYAKANIKNFCVIEQSTGDKTFYYFGLETDSNEHIKLTPSAGSLENQIKDVSETNKFLGSNLSDLAPVVKISN